LDGLVLYHGDVVFLGFRPQCVAMLTTLFLNASTFVSVNNSLSLRTLLHRSIRQGCPLAPYLYVLLVEDYSTSRVVVAHLAP
jgi:hypothetical protein